jgi:hypothetical protein
MNPILAWAITILMCLVIMATPARVIRLMLLVLIAGPLAFLALLAFV